MKILGCRLVVLISTIVAITASERLRGFDRNANIQIKPPLAVPEEFEGLNENFLRLTLQAARLSSDIMRPNTDRLYPDATIFMDGPDKTMVNKIDDICFVTFRGTVLYDLSLIHI